MRKRGLAKSFSYMALSSKLLQALHVQASSHPKPYDLEAEVF